MSDFVAYRRKAETVMRPYIQGENLEGVVISDEASRYGSPRVGDMIALDHSGRMWLITGDDFDDNYVSVI